MINISDTGIDNDALYHGKYNEKINDNHQIFEIPGQNENPRWQTLRLALYMLNV